MKKVLQNMDLNQLFNLIDTCTQYAYTNINTSTFLNLASSLLGSGILDRISSGESLFEDMHIPMEGKFQYGTANGASVLTLNIPNHTQALHEFIYGQYYPANP